MEELSIKLPELNMPFVALAGLIPMIVGFIYYHPKVMGTMWMEQTGMTDEKIKANAKKMPMIYLASLVLAVMLAFSMIGNTIHQMGLFSLFQGDETQAGADLYNAVADLKSDAFRTFKHGALHGFVVALLIALPILGTNALFEQKGGKYIFVNWLYWAITLTLMGGFVCAMA